jgi:hypothetical protein
LTVTEALVIPPGDHRNAPPPGFTEGVNATGEPEQTLVPDMETCGIGNTVTVAAATLEQPFTK